MKSPADLVAHLNANLPAAWTVCALPKPLRRPAPRLRASACAAPG